MDMARIQSFFLKLEAPLPAASEGFEEFAEAQSEKWGVELSAFQKFRSIWAREWLKLESLMGAREPKEEAIEAQKLVLQEHRVELDSRAKSLLKARALEEVSRALPQAAAGSKASERFLMNQLERAESYLGRHG